MKEMNEKQEATPLAAALDAQRINRLAHFDVPGHKGGRMNPELPEYFVFYIESSERRLVSEEQALADMILSYMTNRSLSRYYTNAGRNDLAAKDEANAAYDKDQIIKLIYRKRRPSIPTRD